MKKRLSLLLVLALVFSLLSCTSAPDTVTTVPTDTQPQQTTAAQTIPETTEQTTPVQTAPPQTEPSQPAPSQTAPVQTAPPQTEPVQTQPAQTTPPQTQPVQTAPPQTEPVQTQPEQTAPAQTQPQQTAPPQTEPTETEAAALDPNGSYTTKEDVALYIHLYGRLPGNFITKSEARSYGWSGGSLEPYAPGKCIGGDRFYNREGLLPGGHTYYECDIGTLGSSGGRGAKRIVFSADGLVYYTGNHYGSFELLYGEP